nr:hypothetical protein BaRGS_008118 [Batillaria attramentaria]
MSHSQRDVMFVLSQMGFGDYLDDPCYAAASSSLPRPVDLKKKQLDVGDFDVLIIHRQYGILAGAGPDPAMTDDVYEDLVARFAGPATVVDLINQAPDLAYLAGPPGTGKTLTAVIMSLEWLRQNGNVDILSRNTLSLAAAHLIKQQLEETARLILGEQAANRVHLHDNLKQDGALDRLVATLTARPTADVCLIADEAEDFG